MDMDVKQSGQKRRPSSTSSPDQHSVIRLDYLSTRFFNFLPSIMALGWPISTTDGGGGVNGRGLCWLLTTRPLGIVRRKHNRSMGDVCCCVGGDDNVDGLLHARREIFIVNFRVR